MNDGELTKIFIKPDTGALLELAFIVAAATLLILVTQTLLPWIAERLHGKRRLRVLAMVPLLRLLIVVATLLLTVPLIIEPSLQNMVALLGTVGLALGFALKDYASSLIAGIVAVSEMPYRNGDWIEVNGIYGEVTHIGMRTVQIVTPDDALVSIPHLKLWNDPVFNANNGSPRLQCVADFYLHPQHDAVQVKRVLREVALTSPYLHIHAPVAVIAQEQPWGTRYRLKAYPVDSRQQFQFITDLTVRGKGALSELGVSFAIAQAPAGQGGPKTA